MKINTAIQYGVRSLSDIAYHSEGSPVQLKDISERQDVPPKYIGQIFLKLKKGGIVKSVRGPTGGYFLTRRPDETTVGDVIRAIDGKSIQLVNCEADKQELKKSCERLQKCVVSEIWDEASKILMDYFESVTLEQLCERARKRGVGI